MQQKAPAPPPPSGPRYVAVYDYTAADDDEISFQEGKDSLPPPPLSLSRSLSISLVLSLFSSLRSLSLSPLSSPIPHSAILSLTLSLDSTLPSLLLFPDHPPPGDAIIDVTVIDEGWMEGRVQRTGQYGMLPSNYVEKM